MTRWCDDMMTWWHDSSSWSYVFCLMYTGLNASNLKLCRLTYLLTRVKLAHLKTTCETSGVLEISEQITAYISKNYPPFQSFPQIHPNLRTQCSLISLQKMMLKHTHTHTLHHHQFCLPFPQFCCYCRFLPNLLDPSKKFGPSPTNFLAEF